MVYRKHYYRHVSRRQLNHVSDLLRGAARARLMLGDKEIARRQRENNSRRGDGKLLLERCFNCEPNYGKPNAGGAASDHCAWCGWTEEPMLPGIEEEA